VGERWLILADDLTGAADAAIAFARRGLRTEVTWGERLAGEFPDAQVLAYDCDSRRSSAAEAGEKHAQAAARFLRGTSAVLYKKIDSTLRGQPAAEIAALCKVLHAPGKPAFGICAPANPPLGRTTRDGHVFVQGEPLESTETWQREHSYPSADLAGILDSAALHAIKLPLAEVRAGGATLRASVAAAAESAAAHPAGTILVCDAETSDDLAAIVAAARAHRGVRFFIGTAGLASALAESLPRSACQHAVTPSRHGALVVVGSLASSSRAAARALAASAGVRHVQYTTPMLLGEEAGTRAKMALDIRAALERGTDVLVEMPREEEAAPSIGPALVRALATALSPALPRMSGLIATGGETAAALLRQCYVGQIRLVDEIEAGTSLGLMIGETRMPLITKPGAFGDAHSLLRSLERLRLIRQTGTVA